MAERFDSRRRLYDWGDDRRVHESFKKGGNKKRMGIHFGEENVHLKNQKVPVLPRLFDVDPAGFALASSGTNTDMLLHTPQARVHRFIIKQKRPLLKGPFRGT